MNVESKNYIESRKLYENLGDELLVKQKAEPCESYIEASDDGHYQDQRGCSYLHHAAATDQHYLVSQLLDKGEVAASVIAYDGSTPADVAAAAGHHQMAERLRHPWPWTHLAAAEVAKQAGRHKLANELRTTFIDCTPSLHSPAEMAATAGQHDLAEQFKQPRPRDYSKAVDIAEHLLQTYNLMKWGDEEPEDKPHPGFLAKTIKRLTKRIQTSFKENKTVNNEDLYNLLIHKINYEDNVRDVVALANLGCPVRPTGDIRVSVLKLTIDLDRPKSLTTLLALGADPFFRIGGCDLLQYAWKIPDLTVLIKMIITRMYHHRLQQEIRCMDSKSHLESVSLDLLKSLENHPNKVTISVSLLNDLKLSDTRSLTSLMCDAISRNCRVLTNFLHAAGGNAYSHSHNGRTAMHHTIDDHTNMEEMLMTYMSGSLYIADCEGRLPCDILEQNLKNTLEMNLAIREFHKLEKSINSAHTDVEKNEVKCISLLIGCFYYTCISSEKQNTNWRAIYSHLLEIINGKVIGDNDGNKEYEYSWILALCKKIICDIPTQKIFESRSEKIGLPEIVECITELNKSITILSDKTYRISQKTGDIDYQIVSLKPFLKKANKIAIEGGHYFLFHMLKQSVDDHLNDLIQSPQIHHAAASGEYAIVAYLLHTCKVNPNVLDINGNTAVHIAYMNGHESVADYILTKCDSINSIINYSGKNPFMIKEAQNAYKDLYQMIEEDPATEENIESAEALVTNRLERWLHRTKGISFKTLIANNVVDFTKGEAKIITNLAEKFAQDIGDEIARINNIFQGKLFLVGSVGDKARLYAPDEFDFTWILYWDNVLSVFEIMPRDQWYKGITQKISVQSDQQIINELLQKTNLLDEFYRCAQEAIKKVIPLMNSRLAVILPGVKKIGCGVCVTLVWYGEEYKLLIIKIDLVPVIKTLRPSNFDHAKLTKKLDIQPHLDAAYIVQTNIGEGEFRISNTLLEQNIYLLPSYECQQFVFRTAKLMSTELKTEKWAPKSVKDQLTFFDFRIFKAPTPRGFLLKSAYFHLLESLPESKDWQNNCIVDRLKDLFLVMCRHNKNEKCMDPNNCRHNENEKCLEPGKVRNYFSPTTQPPEIGYMAPTIYEFIRKNETELKLKQGI